VKGVAIGELVGDQHRSNSPPLLPLRPYSDEKLKSKLNEFFNSVPIGNPNKSDSRRFDIEPIFKFAKKEKLYRKSAEEIYGLYVDDSVEKAEAAVAADAAKKASPKKKSWWRGGGIVKSRKKIKKRRSTKRRYTKRRYTKRKSTKRLKKRKI